MMRVMSDETGPDLLQRMTDALRAEGLRVTRQRVAILTVLSEASDHPPVDEVHRRTREIDPSVSLATVYRTLGVLESHGIAHRHSFEGAGARFEIADTDHHDHIIDLDSGAVIEFTSPKIEALQAQIAAELGYEVIHHRLELYCRRQGPARRRRKG